MAYDNNNIFAKILRGEIPAIKLYEDEQTLSFMDIMPQVEGHCLVIPKVAAETIFDLPPGYGDACVATVQKVGTALKQAFSTDGIVIYQLNGADAGQTVPHLHFHLLPTSLGTLMGGRRHASEMADAEQLKIVAQKIIAAM